MQVTLHFTISTTLSWFRLFWCNRCGECQWLMGSGICCGQKWVCYHYLTSRALPLISIEQCNKLHFSFRIMRLCEFCWYHVLCIGALFIFSRAWAHFTLAKVHDHEIVRPLDHFRRPDYGKLKLNFAWRKTYAPRLSTKCYFMTILFMWALLQNKL